MDAFATAADLGTRLKRTFTGDEVAWITSLLEDASTYLREDVLLGQQVYPQAQSTFTAYLDDDELTLPQSPVVSVDSVQREGEDVRYTRRDNRLRIHRHRSFRVEELPVEVTFTYGYTTVPDQLVRWTCVLVSQVLIPLEQQLGLTVGGLSSIAIDDFKAAFADAGDNTGITLSDRNIALIRQSFGVSASTVVSAAR